ncbi:MAG: DUF6259 domain-containing protein, partial [Phycisphaerales bacterium JB063]
MFDMPGGGRDTSPDRSPVHLAGPALVYQFARNTAPSEPSPVFKLLVLFSTVAGCWFAGVGAAAGEEAEDRQTVRSGRLEMVLEEGGGQRVLALRDEAAGVSWLASGSALWRAEEAVGLQGELSVRPLSDGEVELTLTLHNPTPNPITTGISFPRLEGLAEEDTPALRYCYPRQDLLLGQQAVQLDESYSGRFPLQFMAVDLPGRGGVYLMTCDTQMLPKRYRLSKADRVAMSAFYPGVRVGPGETVVLPPARLGVYEGDWHAAFDAYRRWVAEWYEPVAPRKGWLRSVFSFRQVFLYANLDTPGLFDPVAGTLSIVESVEADRERFGHIDYVHLFDWSQTPDQGRVGAYSPWHHLPRDAFNREVDQLRKMGMPVGLYFEGYLVSPVAELVGRPGREWQLRNHEGGRYDPFGSGDDYLCPAVLGWRDYLTHATTRVAEQTPADGFYIDQFGFGYQYACHDPTHGHDVPS